MKTGIAMGLTSLALVCACHAQRATVLPRGDDTYEIIGQAPTEQQAYLNAESEGKYNCQKREKEMVVLDQQSVYQGADKNAKADVKGTNVALAMVTGRSGKERNADDYKVTLKVTCR